MCLTVFSPVIAVCCASEDTVISVGIIDIIVHIEAIEQRQVTPFELFHIVVRRPIGGVGSRDNASLGADVVKPLIAWTGTQSGNSLTGDDRS